MWYVAHLIHCMVHIHFRFIYFLHSSVTLFTIALIKCSACQYSTFCILFFHKVTFSFSCTYYLLNTLQSSSFIVHTKLTSVFFFFVYVTRNTAHGKTFYIHSLTSIFAKGVFNSLLHDFTYLQKNWFYSPYWPCLSIDFLKEKTGKNRNTLSSLTISCNFKTNQTLLCTTSRPDVFSYKAFVC